jgi:serpin B
MTKRSAARVLAGLAIATAATAGGCAGEKDDPAPVAAVSEARSTLSREVAPPVAPADRQALADGNAAFALALYEQVEAEHPNLVFSPASISTALAMAHAGARGETESEMAAALRFTLPQDRLHPAMNELTAALASRGEGKRGADGGPFRLRVVNTTWAQADFPLLPGFLDVLGVNYGAGVNLLDFASDPEAGRQAINGWVADQTEQRIKDLLKPGIVTSRTRVVLTNAVYFNAAWEIPFVAERTADRPFTRKDGSLVQVPMMSRGGSLRAGAVPGLARAVVLPYEDQRLSMLVVLPEVGQLAALESQIGTAGLGAIDAALVERSVSLLLPRFRFETPVELGDALKALGMLQAFDADRANFRGLSNQALYITAVVHKAFIAVAEKGTEAAAATAVVFGDPVSAPIEQPFPMLVDRPFLFFLRDASGAILFMGRVADPGAMKL